jgi:adenylosuccinate synthase
VILRQLPAAALDGTLKVILPAGSYIDVRLLLDEVKRIDLDPSQLVIDPRAHVILPQHIDWERSSGLLGQIGSTGSGTGSAVIARMARNVASIPSAQLAANIPELREYLGDTVEILRASLEKGERIIVEGTQGFGLSPLHGDYWPNATSRDTTAAAFVAEAGLSPLDVDDVTLVLRAFTIRVGGNSGPLKNERDWLSLQEEADAPIELTERTSVTNKVRRVGDFDFELARRAIAVNCPTRVVLNHLDHVDWTCRSAGLTNKAWEYIRYVEAGLGRSIDWIGTGEEQMVELSKSIALQA